MAITIPDWLLGRHTTSVLITPQDWAPTTPNDGTMTLQDLDLPNPTIDVVFRSEEISVQYSWSTENITSMASYEANYVPIERELVITISEIMTRSGDTSITGAAAIISPYQHIQIYRGTSFWDFYGVVKDYSEDLRKSKSIAKLSLQPVQNNLTNTFSSAGGTIYVDGVVAPVDNPFII